MYALSPPRRRSITSILPPRERVRTRIGAFGDRTPHSARLFANFLAHTRGPTPKSGGNEEPDRAWDDRPACVGLGNLRAASYVDQAMLRSFLRRSRVAVLLLLFGLGMAGTALANAALGSQMEGPMHGVTSGGSMCPGCGADEQRGMMTGSCSVTSCWTAPALPAQSAAPQPHSRVAFNPPAEAILSGFAAGPDPHPPRFFLHE